MKNVLAISSNQILLQSIASILRNQGAFFHLHTAHTSQRAFHLLKTIPVDLVITTLRSPRFCGLRFIKKLAKEYPALKVIVMARNKDSLKLNDIERFPSAIFIDQSTDLGLLTKRLYSELHIGYGGHLRGLALTSFLQMLEMESCTCTLSVSSKNKNGLLWLKNGELIGAKSPTDEGKEAALGIVAWKNVSIDIDYAPYDIEPQFSLPLMMLFIEGGQKYDEILDEVRNRREYDRFEIHIATEYKIGNRTRQCVLHDISLSGVYIEIDQNIGVGEIITLTLSPPTLNSKYSIEATIVHKDGKGAGARFKIDDPEQQKIIKDIVDISSRGSEQEVQEDVPSPV
ncbi:MAG: PilZ domain-containing protein [Desulforhopalus sp.]